MGRQRAEDRQARVLDAYYSLPPLQRGMAISLLLGYAVTVVAMDGVVIFFVVRAGYRGWRQWRVGPVAGLRSAISPALAVALSAAAVQWAAGEWLTRSVENGRAHAWLEQGERWLARSQPGEDRQR